MVATALLLTSRSFAGGDKLYVLTEMQWLLLNMRILGSACHIPREDMAIDDYYEIDFGKNDEDPNTVFISALRTKKLSKAKTESMDLMIDACKVKLYRIAKAAKFDWLKTEVEIVTLDK